MKEQLSNNKMEGNGKSVEIKEEEFRVIRDIFSFSEKLSKETYIENSTHAFTNSNFTAEELEQRKVAELSKTLASLSEDEAFDLKRKIKRQAQYEAYKADIDFRNEQFEKLVQYIESKEIWKHKFSTNYSFNLGQYDEIDFKGDGSESRYYDELNAFAGQSRDSLYYVSKSGLSLRLKRSLLHEKGISSVLQEPQELILFFNRREQQRRDLDIKESFNEIDNLNAIDFPSELVSFEPKLEYNAFEFSKFDFNKNTNSGYTSSIQIIENQGRTIVKNYDNEHPGHQINKIYF